MSEAPAAGMGRLAARLAATIVAALAALAGANLTWVTGTTPGRTVATDQGTFAFPPAVRHLDATNVAPLATGLAVLLVVAAALALLVGPRARAILLGGAVAVAVALVGVVLVRWDAVTPGAGETLSRGAGGVVCLAGAVLAGAGAAWSLPIARRVGRVRMPSTTPEHDDEP